MFLSSFGQRGCPLLSRSVRKGGLRCCLRLDLALRLSAFSSFPALKDIQNKLRASAQAVQGLQHGSRKDRQALLFQFKEKTICFVRRGVSKLQQVTQSIRVRLGQCRSFLALLEFVVLR